VGGRLPPRPGRKSPWNAARRFASALWRRLAEGLEGRGWLDRAMAIDLLDYLPNDGLAKTDAAAAAQGLEVRCPMLHPAVVDLARRMPPAVKWRRRRGRLPQGKRVLREALADLLPPEVRRRGKMGFGVPIDRWLAGPLAGWMRDRLLGPRARTRRLLRRKAVERLVAEHTARRADHSERLWALVVLETWMRAMDL